MSDPSGRYDALPTYDRVLADGRVQRLRQPRLPATAPVATRHLVTAGERLDHLAARLLDDPYAWWRFADASPGVPVDELDRAGRWLDVPERGGPVP